MFRNTGKRLLTLMAATAAIVALVAAPAVACPATKIPDAAMLQPADLGGVAISPAAAALRPELRPPQPFVRYHSAAKRVADRAVQAVYPVGDVRPTVLLEYVATYRGGGAAQYLRELRQAVRHSTGRTDDGRTWRILDQGIAGRHSMLLSVSQTVEYGDTGSRVQTIYVAVARVGHAVVVLADIGWEVGDGHEVIVRGLAPAAVLRASVLR